MLNHARRYGNYKVHGKTVTGYADTKQGAIKMRNRWKGDRVRGRIHIKKIR